jgi:hypothetical protein
MLVHSSSRYGSASVSEVGNAAKINLTSKAAGRSLGCGRGHHSKKEQGKFKRSTIYKSRCARNNGRTANAFRPLFNNIIMLENQQYIAFLL